MSQTTKQSYQFIAVALNLFNCLDVNCRSVFGTLIQLSSYYGDESGWFYRTNADMEAQTKLSRKVLNAALDALYINGIIDIKPCEKGRGKKQLGRKYKVLFESFNRWEMISIEDSIKNPEYEICTCDYKKSLIPSFQLKDIKSDIMYDTTSMTLSQTSSLTSPQTSTTTSSPTSSQSTNNIYNIDNTDNIKNIENIELIYNKLIENQDRVIEEGLDKFDYELYSETSMSFLDDHGTELFNSYRYFNSDEFDGKQKFYELVSSDSSIGYEEIEQLFKYCIRTQAARTSTEEMVSVSSAPASCPVQSEEEFLTALFGKMDGVMAAPQQEYVDYAELVDDCVLFYGWREERARMFIEELMKESKTHFMGVS